MSLSGDPSPVTCGSKLLGHGEEALKDLDRALEAQPDSVRALRVRASAYQMLRRNDEALTDLDKALMLEPDNAGTLLSRGEVYAALGRTEEALSDVDRALTLEPRSVHALLMRADLYRKTDHWQESLDDLNRAAELDPTRAETFRARKSYRSGSEESLKDYERALSLEPLGDAIVYEPTSPIHIVFSALYSARHDQGGGDSLARALKEVNLALQQDPENALAFGARGRIHMGLERYDEAITDLERAHEINPSLEWVKRNLETARRVRANFRS